MEPSTVEAMQGARRPLEPLVLRGVRMLLPPSSSSEDRCAGPDSRPSQNVHFSHHRCASQETMRSPPFTARGPVRIDSNPFLVVCWGIPYIHSCLVVRSMSIDRLS